MDFESKTLNDLQGAKGERRHALPDELKLGAAHLRVQNLDTALPFYTDVIGLRLRDRTDSTARFAAGGDDVVVLHETATGRQPSRHSGLYHVALLYPTRLELARVAQRIAESRTPVQGASDHGTHEAIYLPDPDGNGLELAADRPRDQWPDMTDITKIAPNPLDMGGLFNLTSGREVEPEAEDGLAVGHIHLHVGSVEKGLAFYRDLVGFDLITFLDSAAFVSAGGYHHHLAFNTWQGVDAPPSPLDSAGLDHWTVELLSAEQVAAVEARLTSAGHETTAIEGGFEVRDPWGNALHLISG